MRVAVAGGTGTVGTALVAALREAGDEVLVLSRRDGPGLLRWDPAAGAIPAQELLGVDAVVNLAAADIARKWSTEVKQELRDGALLPARLLATTLASLPEGPRLLVQVTNALLYGTALGGAEVDEESPAGTGFAAELNAEWERSLDPVRDVGLRTVVVRAGQVVTAEKGVLKATLGPYKAGFGTKFGAGANVVSWISLHDLVRVVQHLLHDPAAEGVYVAAAPNPVRSVDLTRAVGARLGKRWVLRLPRFMPRLIFGPEAGAAVLQADVRLVPRRLQAAGFAFDDATITDAVARYVPPP